MLLLLLRLSQSNPTTRTTGLFPKLVAAITQLPFLGEDGGCGLVARGVDGLGEATMRSSSRKSESFVNGLETLLGGDPVKNRGGVITVLVWSCSPPPPPPFVRMKSKISLPEFDSHNSIWWLSCQRRDREEWWLRAPTRRGLGQITASLRSETAAFLLISSKAFCWIPQLFIIFGCWRWKKEQRWFLACLCSTWAEETEEEERSEREKKSLNGFWG